MEKLCEVSIEGVEELMKVNWEFGENVKVDFLYCSEKFVIY